MDEFRGDKLKHLLYLKNLEQETITEILDTAEHFLNHDNQPFGSEKLLQDNQISRAVDMIRGISLFNKNELSQKTVSAKN